MAQALRQPTPREHSAPWERFPDLFTLVAEFGVGASSEARVVLQRTACALIEEHGRNAAAHVDQRLSVAIAARDFQAAMYWTAVMTSVERCRQD
ncbi:hypothetical protein [Flavisphingomonas formosensis]|uniref:hypothetical protein n=1 Tax=Flavisphingomonas formosensis TaxID=861534 RepID=UPI0012FB7902|nr:hypothetical protein [Sphingomonas formosensis]